ncbi:MAG: hypothetical protein ABJA10_09430 [Aestuariivirga sp.]
MADDAILANVITILVGFGGAIVGACVSGHVAKQQLKEAKTQQQKAEFFKLMIRLSLVQTDFVNLKRSIDESIAEANAHGMNEMQTWAKVQGNAGDLDRISFSPDELTCLFEARQFDLITEIIGLGLKHTRLFDAFNTYSRLRVELKNHMPNDEVDGSFIGSNLTAADRQRLQPRFLELASLIDSILDLLPDYIEESTKVSSSIGPAARKYFGDNNFPVIASA